MKTSNKILLGLFAALALNVLTGMIFVRSSLGPSGIGNGETVIEGKGPTKKVRLTISDFKGLNIGDNFEVILTQGEEFVEIEAAENIIDFFDLKVENNSLQIDAKEDYTLVPNSRVIVHVGFKNLEWINVWGNSLVSSEKTLNIDRLEVGIHGSSELNFPIEAEQFELNINGSGRGIFTGQINRLDLSISGSGYIDADELISRKADIQISGAGHAKVNVTDYLEAQITGSGSVEYSGSAKVDRQVSGAGSIYKK